MEEKSVDYIINDYNEEYIWKRHVETGMALVEDRKTGAIHTCHPDIPCQLPRPVKGRGFYRIGFL